MNFTSAQYIKDNTKDKNIFVKVTIQDDSIGVPIYVQIDEKEAIYTEIKKQVDSGKLTIKE
jgi:hypothetical protein|tara:strand:+ start:749 stop:931 length:183 start_codon:yes stop_codon:yes gene_type:complete